MEEATVQDGNQFNADHCLPMGTVANGAEELEEGEEPQECLEGLVGLPLSSALSRCRPSSSASSFAPSCAASVPSYGSSAASHTVARLSSLRLVDSSSPSPSSFGGPSVPSSLSTCSSSSGCSSSPSAAFPAAIFASEFEISSIWSSMLESGGWRDSAQLRTAFAAWQWPALRMPPPLPPTGSQSATEGNCGGIYCFDTSRFSPDALWDFFNAYAPLELRSLDGGVATLVLFATEKAASRATVEFGVALKDQLLWRRSTELLATFSYLRCPFLMRLASQSETAGLVACSCRLPLPSAAAPTDFGAVPVGARRRASINYLLGTFAGFSADSLVARACASRNFAASSARGCAAFGSPPVRSLSAGPSSVWRRVRALDGAAEGLGAFRRPAARVDRRAGRGFGGGGGGGGGRRPRGRPAAQRRMLRATGRLRKTDAGPPPGRLCELAARPHAQQKAGRRDHHPQPQARPANGHPQKTN
eukprot:GHVT01068225.1.p1 GENE.GHVT01068225.1~~GHVT01068225.1.p1  ORF type:complete len:475 (-),score=120.54 GHVT01068225.1:784-2208(-)